MESFGQQHGPVGNVTVVSAETFCVSGRSGQVRRGSEQGLYVRDTRVLNHLTVAFDGAEPLALTGHTVDGAAARFTACSVPRAVEGPDPAVLLERRRVVSGSLWEWLHVRNLTVQPLLLDVEVEVDADFAYIFDVRHQRSTRQARCEEVPGGLRFVRGEQCTTVRASQQPDDVYERQGVLRWRVDLPPRADWSVDLEVGFEDRGGVAWPSRRWAQLDSGPHHPSARFDVPSVTCSDPVFPSLLERSIADLSSLLVEDPKGDDDRFLAAGSPWYLTLFGRDSLWSAAMTLPLGLDVARGTLRALARRQGRVRDPATEEAPGKIIHEVRHGGLVERSDLPPLYYGTMDATPLFVSLLHEAWRWGLPDDEVERLLPAAEAALDWLATDGDPDGDGFLEYRRSGERGLANQGWKDSEDGIQFADGRLATSPLALCEVQGYAYDAARRGAELLERFDRPGSERWRVWAAALRDRFRANFWISHPDGDHPAIALDGRKQPVDSVASNMGHLPATGILNPEECELVAARLASSDMASGWGLRTLTAASPRFSPLSYHGGSVWPHDTAIAVVNLAAAGCTGPATQLLRDLVDAAGSFDLRLPELFAGEQRQPRFRPLPYPAACRPQAWAAGASLFLLRAALGLHPDLPNGRLVLQPLWPPPFDHLSVRGLRVGAAMLDVTIDAETGVTVTGIPNELTLEVRGDYPLRARGGSTSGEVRVRRVTRRDRSDGSGT
jgi:glycogen debranching enzyme